MTENALKREKLPQVSTKSVTKTITWATPTEREASKMRNFYEVRLLLLSCISVGLLLILWLMLEFRSLQTTTTDGPRVSCTASFNKKPLICCILLWVNNKVVQGVPKVRYQVFFTVIEADETRFVAVTVGSSLRK